MKKLSFNKLERKNNPEGGFDYILRSVKPHTEGLTELSNSFIENGFQLQCQERNRIQGLLVLRRITTQANLEYPHRLYLKNLLYLTDFYWYRFIDLKLIINVNLLLMEQLNGFDPKLLPRETFEVFTSAISILSDIFHDILHEFHPDDDESRKWAS